MNLKNLKKVHEDEHVALFRSKEGHECRVSKRGLSEKLRKELSSLPLHANEGDVIEPSQEAVPELPVEKTALPTEPQAGADMGGMDALPEQAAPSEPIPEAQPQPQVTAPPDPTQPQLSPEETRQKSKEEYIKKHAEEMGKEDALAAQDIGNGHISPKKMEDLYADKSVPSKILNFFALLVGGAGAGLSHQPNALLELMNKELERDFEAQKKSKDNAQNWYKAGYESNFSKAGAEKMDAETAKMRAETQINNMRIQMFHKFLGTTAKLPENSKEKAIANQLLPAVGQAIDAKNQETNARVAQAMAEDPKGKFQREQDALRGLQLLGESQAGQIADMRESKLVPGFGMSQKPISQGNVDRLESYTQVDNLAKKYIDFANKYKDTWKNLNPEERTKVKAAGGAIAADLLARTKGADNLGGALTAVKAALEEKKVEGDPTSWHSQWTAVPKMEMVLELNREAMNNLSHISGLPKNPKTQKEYNTKLNEPKKGDGKQSSQSQQPPKGMKMQRNIKTGETRFVPE